MKTNKGIFIQMAAAIFAIGLAGSTANAATIYWNGAQNVTSDFDVSTDGTLVDAFALSLDYGVFGQDVNTTTTLNGVTFQSLDLPLDLSSSSTTGNYSFAAYSGGGSGSLINMINLGYGANGNTFYSGLSSQYQALLASGGTATANQGVGADYSDVNFTHTLALTISGLTVGETYQFQWWNSSANHQIYGLVDNHTLNTTATAGNSVSLSANDPYDYDSAGQFAIGTFTADAVTQEIDFTGATTGTDDPLVNAFQLRSGVEAVPEPSTMALATLWGSGILILFRRRK
jgi:hypothetical protein